MAAGIACEACGKKFAWSSQFAGKKMKCKCGAAITIPVEAPSAGAAPAGAAAPAIPQRAASVAAKSSSEAKVRSAPPMPSAAPVNERRIEASDDEGPMLDIVEPAFALAGPGVGVGVGGPGVPGVLACPSCGSTLTPGSILCVGCGYNLQLRRKMIAAPTRILGNDGMVADQTDTAYLVREKIAPPIIMALGYLLWVAFMAAGWEADSTAGLAGIAIVVALMTLFATTFMTAGCFIAAKLLDTNFGSLPTAVIKLAAMYLLANGVTEMITYGLGGFGGGIIYTSIGYGIYWILLMWLFELDGFEVWVTASIFFLLQIAAFFGFIVMLTTIGFGGLAAGMGGGGMGGPATVPIGSEYEDYEGDYGDDFMMEDDEGVDPEMRVPEFQDPNAPAPEALPAPAPEGTIPAPSPEGSTPQAAPEAAPMSNAERAWPWAQTWFAGRTLACAA